MPATSAADHLKALIACASVTPADAGAQDYLADVLATAGFTATRRTFSAEGTADVANLFASIGSGSPHLVFAGHTDVVPPGNEARWSHPPYGGEIAGGAMYGRGAVDMKGGIAAFLAAAERYGAPGTGTLSLLITGDEEGVAINGTVKLLAWALAEGHTFDAALVGEPTSQRQVGDTIKIGRRGSLSGTITVGGRQGHVAYPHHADNPIPRLAHLVERLSHLRLDQGSEHFEPSNLEFTALETHNRTFNVIPGEASARFNVRFNDRWTAETLTEALKREAGVDEGAASIAFQPNPSPCFLTRSPALTGTLSAAITAVTGQAPQLSTGGGTSDARFFHDVCPVAELGLIGDTMHQVDERVPLGDLATLTDIYAAFLTRFFAPERT
jgi:succinyl-diaminopimelate desuccinylase